MPRSPGVLKGDRRRARRYTRSVVDPMPCSVATCRLAAHWYFLKPHDTRQYVCQTCVARLPISRWPRGAGDEGPRLRQIEQTYWCEADLLLPDSESRAHICDYPACRALASVTITTRMARGDWIKNYLCTDHAAALPPSLRPPPEQYEENARLTASQTPSAPRPEVPTL